MEYGVLFTSISLPLHRPIIPPSSPSLVIGTLTPAHLVNERPPPTHRLHNLRIEE